MLLLPLFCDIVTVSLRLLSLSFLREYAPTHDDRKARFQPVYEDENSAYAKTIREELQWFRSRLRELNVPTCSTRTEQWRIPKEEW